MAFTNSRDLTFNHGTFNDIQGNYYHYQTSPGEQGISVLFRQSCPDATYDSQERHPPPQCLSGTREAMLEEILTWIDIGEEAVLWLSGPAGAGKSAIAQTVADTCARDGTLAASFFFSRRSCSRNTPTRLISSIVYQIAISIPEKRIQAGKVIEDDPSVLHKSLATQVDRLLNPLFSSAPLKSTFLIIIDGLDECAGDDNQRDVVRLIAELVHRVNVQLRCLITSRSEPQIQAAFHELSHDVNCISLSDRHHISAAKRDIFTLFCDGFDRICEKRRDVMGSVVKPWPPDSVITQLVSKSKGMFIYASTVLKYVDDDDHRPTERLKEILKTPRGPTPFVELDQLYHQIISTCPDTLLLLRILTVVILQKRHQSCVLGINEIEMLLQLQPGTVKLVLRRMNSIINVTMDGQIQFFHAPFRDFILNKGRAGKYFIDYKEGHAFVAQILVRYLGGWSDSLVTEFSTEQRSILIYGLEAWPKHCCDTHALRHPLILKALYKRLRFHWWHPFYGGNLVKNAVTKGMRDGIHWLSGLESPLGHVKYSSSDVTNQVFNAFWQQVMKIIAPMTLQIITLYETLDDVAIVQLLGETYTLYWAGNPDWIGRSIRHPTGKGYQPCWLRFETPLPSQQANNIYAPNEGTTKIFLTDFDKLTQLADEFFVTQKGAGDYAVDYTQSHTHLAGQCIRILSDTSLNRHSSVVQYAQKHWATHLAQAQLRNEELLETCSDDGKASEKKKRESSTH